MKILCGCDPEVGVVDKKGNLLSACDKVPGTKTHPFPIEGSVVGLKIQEDNVTLEFNIEPTSTKNFTSHVQYALKELQAEVVKYFGAGTKIDYRDGHLFEAKDLAHPKLQVFGCDPDFLAYERGTMRAALDPKVVGNERYYGGHIHIGWDTSVVTEKHIPRWAIVQGMELGGYIRTRSEGYDPQPLRRKHYGIPGLFRAKPYGLEYRTPSNFWLSNSSAAQRIVNAAQTIISRPVAYRALYDIVNWADVQSIVLDGQNAKNWDAKWQRLNNQWDEFCATAEEN